VTAPSSISSDLDTQMPMKRSEIEISGSFDVTYASLISGTLSEQLLDDTWASLPSSTVVAAIDQTETPIMGGFVANNDDSNSPFETFWTSTPVLRPPDVAPDESAGWDSSLPEWSGSSQDSELDPPPLLTKEPLNDAKLSTASSYVLLNPESLYKN
jgi:hypothetical protein